MIGVVAHAYLIPTIGQCGLGHAHAKRVVGGIAADIAGVFSEQGERTRREVEPERVMESPVAPVQGDDHLVGAGRVHREDLSDDAVEGREISRGASRHVGLKHAVVLIAGLVL